MIYYKPAQITINAPMLAAGYIPLSSTAVPAHTSLIKKILALVPDLIRNLMTACKKNISHEFDIANLFPPDLWGYVHRFSYWLSYGLVWQISVRRTLWDFEHRFVHELRMKSKYQPNKGVKPKSYAPGDNIYSWRLSVTARAKYY